MNAEDDEMKFSKEYPQWRFYQNIPKLLLPDHNLSLKFTDLFETDQGKHLLKYYIRQFVLSYVEDCLKMETRNNDTRTVSSLMNTNWLHEEMKRLKYIMSFWYDNRTYGHLIPASSLKNNHNKHTISSSSSSTSNESHGLFSQVFTYLGSLFSKPNTRDNNASEQVSSIRLLKNHVRPKYLKDHPNRYGCKIILEGICGVGKTSLLNCMMNDLTLNNLTNYTVGVDFSQKICSFGECGSINLMLWDQAGPERFYTLSPIYYRGSAITFMLFDITDRESFNFVKKQRQFAKENVGTMEKILIGTKSDLSKMRQVSREEAEKYAFNEMDGSLYFEITNTELRDSRVIMWYSALIHFVLLFTREEELQSIE